MTGPRLDIVAQDWKRMTRQLAIKMNGTLALTSGRGLSMSKTFLTAEQASASVNAEAEAANAARALKEGVDTATQAAQLSIESSKKSSTASQVAVIAGAFAIAAACSVM